MNATSPVTPDRCHAELLRRRLQQFRSGETPGATEGRDLDVLTLVGALCLGGADFAAWLVGSTNPALDQTDRYAIVVDAFLALSEPGADASENHETEVAQRLIDTFALEANAETLLQTVRSEFLITAGPLEEVPQAALEAIKRGEWELALRGFVRCRDSLQENTPRDVHGMAAMCLHQLKRFEEADRWAEEGLGHDAALIAIGAAHTQAQLLRRWKGQTTPVISIICTTYNHERYIDSAIRGFLSQDTEFPFEILIHDDASTDGTQAVIRKWEALYPQIIKPVYQTENQFSKGVRPFELLLARARGEFVATCEGDDFWVDGSKLQRQVAFLKHNPDFSCSAHNYYHYLERTLTVRPWNGIRVDHVVAPRTLMGLQRLLWLPTLVFRKTFSAMPPERSQAAIGDQFLTSYLGTLGRCIVFESRFSAVRRENEFSSWSPLPGAEKERMRVKTWDALVNMHQRLGNAQAVADLMAKIKASPLRHISEHMAAAVPAPSPNAALAGS